MPATIPPESRLHRAPNPGLETFLRDLDYLRAGCFCIMPDMGAAPLNLLALALAGVAGAAFAWPMKHVRGWRWEHVWIGQAFTSNLFFPLIALVAFWPRLGPYFLRMSPGEAAPLIGMGAVWGLGGIGFGLSLVLLGFSFTYSVLFSITILAGAVLPLLRHTTTGPAHAVPFTIGLASCVFAAAMLGQAGARRAIEQNSVGPKLESLPMPLPNVGYRLGLLLAMAAGLFSAFQGLALTLSAHRVDSLIKEGISPVVAPMIIWCPVYLGSALIAFTYGLYYVIRGHTLGLFWQLGAGRNWLIVHAMGILGFGGVLLYGQGASGAGHPAKNVAWALYMTFFILSGTCLGFAIAEWRGCSRTTHAWLLGGVLLLVVAVLSLAAS